MRPMQWFPAIVYYNQIRKQDEILSSLTAKSTGDINAVRNAWSVSVPLSEVTETEIR